MQKKIAGFIVGGGMATIVQFIVAGLLSLFVWLPVTHALGLLSGISYNFYHQSRVFESGMTKQKFGKFASYSLCNAGAQSIIVYVLVQYHVPYFIGLGLSIAGLSLLSFLVYNFIIFSKS